MKVLRRATGWISPRMAPVDDAPVRVPEGQVPPDRLEAYRQQAIASILAQHVAAQERAERLSKEEIVRDPNRIPEILEELRKYWEKNPDDRLGQIVGNAAASTGRNLDPYYLEDTELLDYLESQNRG